MTRLSIAATVRDAYNFTFTHLGTIIGLIWLPMVVVTVAGFFAFQRYCDAAIAAISQTDPPALGPAVLLLLGYALLSMFLYAVIYVAVTQLALGQRQGGTMVHFAFGPVEWRMFRALLALFGVLVLLMMLAEAVVTAGMAVTKIATPLQLVLMGLVIMVVPALTLPRFVLPMFAIATAEQEPVLRRAWALTQGNFWRLLAVGIAVLGPLLVLIYAAAALLPVPPLPEMGNSDAQIMVAALRRQQQMMPMLTGLGFGFSPFAIGLLSGASVSVWRALAGRNTDITV